MCVHMFVCVWGVLKNNIFPVTQDTAQVLKFSQLGKKPCGDLARMLSLGVYWSERPCLFPL